jgi:hypothetical protein
VVTPGATALGAKAAGAWAVYHPVRTESSSGVAWATTGVARRERGQGRAQHGVSVVDNGRAWRCSDKSPPRFYGLQIGGPPVAFANSPLKFPGPPQNSYLRPVFGAMAGVAGPIRNACPSVGPTSRGPRQPRFQRSREHLVTIHALLSLSASSACPDQPTNQRHPPPPVLGRGCCSFHVGARLAGEAAGDGGVRRGRGRQR